MIFEKRNNTINRSINKKIKFAAFSTFDMRQFKFNGFNVALYYSIGEFK